GSNPTAAPMTRRSYVEGQPPHNWGKPLCERAVVGRSECAGGKLRLHQLGHGIDLELFHDPCAVGLDRLDADVELLGDLAVHPACHDQLEDLDLAVRELGKALAREPRAVLPG